MKKRRMKSWFNNKKHENYCDCHCASTGACGGGIYFIGFIGGSSLLSSAVNNFLDRSFGNSKSSCLACIFSV
ncbi:MAG: hypothetical protein AABW47_04130 [Nanoarchaeota archaeon]